MWSRADATLFSEDTDGSAVSMTPGQYVRWGLSACPSRGGTYLYTDKRWAMYLPVLLLGPQSTIRNKLHRPRSSRLGVSAELAVYTAVVPFVGSKHNFFSPARFPAVNCLPLPCRKEGGAQWHRRLYNRRLGNSLEMVCVYFSADIIKIITPLPRNTFEGVSIRNALQAEPFL